MHAMQPLCVSDTDTHDSINASSTQPQTHHALVSEAAVATQRLLVASLNKETFISARSLTKGLMLLFETKL